MCVCMTIHVYVHLMYIYIHAYIYLRIQTDAIFSMLQLLTDFCVELCFECRHTNIHVCAFTEAHTRKVCIFPYDATYGYLQEGLFFNLYTHTRTQAKVNISI